VFAKVEVYLVFSSHISLTVLTHSIKLLFPTIDIQPLHIV